MTPTEESRLLAIVLRRIEGKTKSSHVRWFAAATWLLLVAAFVALFLLAPRFGSVLYVVAGIGCVLGVLTSFFVIYTHSLKQWPVLSRYIKVDEVRRRLDELKPDTSLERARER